MRRRTDDTGSENIDGVPARASTSDLLAELARRFRLRYGRLEAVFHDGQPSPRVLIEHRIQRGLDES